MHPSLSVSEPRRSGNNSLIRLQGELLNFRTCRFAHCRFHHAARNGADPFRKQSGRKHGGGRGNCQARSIGLTSLCTQSSYYHVVNLRDLFPLGSTDIRKDCLIFASLTAMRPQTRTRVNGFAPILRRGLKLKYEAMSRDG
jgi:hypothetical protein